MQPYAKYSCEENAQLFQGICVPDAGAIAKKNLVFFNALYSVKNACFFDSQH